MAFGDLSLDAPLKPNKGLEGGACNRQSCQAEPALWFNHGTNKWYCADCRNDIQFDEFNLKDWTANYLPRYRYPMFETREQIDAREIVVDPDATTRHTQTNQLVPKTRSDFPSRQAYRQYLRRGE